jgi:hypothetical protein
MRSGSPAPSRLPGLISERVEDPADPSVSAHGRVFFTIPSGPYRGDYVCSGTAVNSRNRSTVWTAGHCVYELTGGGFVTNWSFVPGYESGAAPYGEWPAKRLTAPRAYQTSQNLHFDFGAAVVRTNADGQRLQTLVGARGIGFDQPRDQGYVAYGYPKELPFDGEHEYTCTSPMERTDQFAGDGPPPMGIRCDMTAGASGGGWIVNGSILSVTSYGYTTRPFELYGPYLSSAARNVYREASGKRKKKGHKNHKGGKGNKGGKGGKGK